MNKIILMAVMIGCAFLAQAEISLADARTKIDKSIADPKVMAETMQQLSPSDQKAFLAEVNSVIAKRPGSKESKVASFINVNAAALIGAGKENIPTLIAEVFATVPLDALCILNERYAKTIFQRDNEAITDQQFEAVAKSVMKLVVERNENVDNGALRDTLAALMFIRSSNGTPDTLPETLIAVLPESAQESARKEWIPNAMAKPSNYEALLSAADDVVEISNYNEVFLWLNQQQTRETFFANLVEGTPFVEMSFQFEKDTFNLDEVVGGLGTTVNGDNILPEEIKKKEPGPYADGTTF